MKKISRSRLLRAEERKRKKAFFYLVILTLVFVLSALCSLPAILAFVKMLNTHHAMQNPAVILLFVSLFTFPCLLLCSVILAWIFYLLLEFRRSFLVLLLPLLSLGGGLAALTWLHFAYDGLPGGKL